MRKSSCVPLSILCFMVLADPLVAVVPGADRPADAATRLTSLADSLDPLASRFNAAKEQLRVVALLSPT